MKKSQLLEIFKDTVLEDNIEEIFDTFTNSVRPEEERTIETFEEIALEIINYQDIIYYARAIEYLRVNDPSFKESLEYASDLGYETKDLSSELLATIHSQETMKELLYDKLDEVKELL
jgi:uncharacterized membrane protein YgaE (UPF0421/DUF939 family)